MFAIWPLAQSLDIRSKSSQRRHIDRWPRLGSYQPATYLYNLFVTYYLWGNFADLGCRLICDLTYCSVFKLWVANIP